LAHGLKVNDPGDRNLDPDGDGMSNWQEYVSNTDPQDGSSVLRVSLLDDGLGGALLRFTAMPEVGYTIQYQTNLTASPWLSLTNIAPQAGTNLIQVLDPNAASGGGRFYRITTPMQP
jgi:hypothetical protein